MITINDVIVAHLKADVLFLRKNKIHAMTDWGAKIAGYSDFWSSKWSITVYDDFFYVRSHTYSLKERVYTKHKLYYLSTLGKIL